MRLVQGWLRLKERRLFTDFDKGLMVGLLIGEGHFGGDGRQPQITLRMHVRHESLFRWIEETFPGGKLYGPYNHDGRQYLQWMARGSYLRDVLIPELDDHLTAELDAHTLGRYEQMKARYHRRLGLPPPGEPDTRPEETSTHAQEPQGGQRVPQVGPAGLNPEDVFERLRRGRPA